MLNVKMILIDQRLYEVGVKDDMQRFFHKIDEQVLSSS